MIPKKPNLLLVGMVAAWLSACATGPVESVEREADYSNLEVRASGSGAWSVSCTGVDRRDKVLSREIVGRGSTSDDVMVLRDLISGKCSFTADDSPLIITLPEHDSNCLFESDTRGVCRMTVGPTATGTFEFSNE